MFTDRFIKVPIILYNKNEADILGYNNTSKEVEVLLRFDINELSNYRPSFNDDDEIQTTGIHLKNGEYFNCEISVKDFEIKVNEFYINNTDSLLK